jgi:metal-dependent hydrolase (beta-lactamase superfamily II)
MVVFKQHYSGSRGNLYEVVLENGRRIMIEAGVQWTKIQKTLDYDLLNIEAWLISHEHL